MYCCYDRKKTIAVPEPFKRYITPIFMKDNGEIQDSGFSIHLTEWEPGCKVDYHSHDGGLEAMYCLSGRGIAAVDGKIHEFRPDTVIIAAEHEKHQIINTGEEMLRVLCISMPPVTGKDLGKRAIEAINGQDIL
ncbi:ectoine synthase [Clostridium sp. AM58-1XD]|uniref:cupin domain-containing protein n=1 Tax=Clostridium sp. AM58-1XD TaxID=2292307 RepID=UPI000E477463|nr:ectoine synthase [Clostridium sp. AM58-1XD]RGY97825.1 cupin domain-containing protein [Clostridium sp. AM58-1XD]